jgi:GT2 family glycosyltransferase
MIAVITVNYNCADRTLTLLRSLERQTDPAFSVAVVENGSAVSDAEKLGSYGASSPLALEVIASAKNLGFSGGNNLAIRRALAAGAQWVALLNPDTEVSPDFIASLRRVATDGIVGLPITEPYGTVYGGLVRWFRSTLPHATTLATASAPRYAIGAAMMVHRSVFERVGYLDERFFLYFEDAEFSLRSARAGISVVMANGPRVRHGVGQSTRALGAPLLLRYHARNALLFNRLCGPWWVRAGLPFWAFFSMVRNFIKAILMPSRRPQARAIRDGISDYYAGRFGQLPS